MKKTNKVLAVLLVALMTFAISGMTAFAASITIKNNSDKTQTDTTDYTWYKILNADIKTKTAVKEADGTLNGDPGQVAYYVTTQAQADAIEGTNLFTVTKAQSSDECWYVDLKSAGTTAEQIATAFDGIKNTKDNDGNNVFTRGSFAMSGTTATASDLDAGYYLVTSGLGTKLVVQTLSDVTIKEKNEYPSLTKAVTPATASIGQDVTYTVTVTIPATAAEKDIKIVDVLDRALTRKNAVTVAGATGLTSLTFAGDGTVTIPAASVKANAGKTITLTYNATVNDNAAINTELTNTAHLVYGKYTSTDVTASVKTHGFTVKKIDGASVNSDTTESEKLAMEAIDGAQFSLWTEATGGTQIYVKKNANGVYRVDTSKTTGSEAIAAGTATIEGLATGTYYLQEEVAPTGYNKLAARVAVTVGEQSSAEGADVAVVNNAGVELPATGGLGTTLFTTFGLFAILAAGVFLVTNKRIAKEEI